jgi:hypothetical protein
MAEEATTRTYTFDELKHSTVVQLREIAKNSEHEALKGYTQLNKDHLITALCKALNIAAHAHHEAHGIDKSKFKSRLKELKKERVEALAAHDHARLRAIRRHRRSLMHRIRRATV